jgi:hypothetical protein
MLTVTFGQTNCDHGVKRPLGGFNEGFELVVGGSQYLQLVWVPFGGSVTDVSKALVGGTGDGGVDGIIDQDHLGLDRIYVQAKPYAESNTVGSGAIRDFFGSLDRYKATKGLFVTASTFSPSARQTAEQLSKRIVLIDGDQLTRLMIRHGVGCRIEETLYIKKVDEEFFSSSSSFQIHPHQRLLEAETARRGHFHAQGERSRPRRAPGTASCGDLSRKTADANPLYQARTGRRAKQSPENNNNEF